jgi:hypothetical protein
MKIKKDGIGIDQKKGGVEVEIVREIEETKRKEDEVKVPKIEIAMTGKDAVDMTVIIVDEAKAEEILIIMTTRQEVILFINFIFS